LQRLDENRARARQVSAPAAWAKVSVEGDLHALLPHHLDQREEAADPDVGVERERDAGKIDELCFAYAFGNAAPVRQLEQLPRGRFCSPIMAVPRTRGSRCPPPRGP